MESDFLPTSSSGLLAGAGAGAVGRLNLQTIGKRVFLVSWPRKPPGVVVEDHADLPEVQPGVLLQTPLNSESK